MAIKVRYISKHLLFAIIAIIEVILISLILIGLDSVIDITFSNPILDHLLSLFIVMVFVTSIWRTWLFLDKKIVFEGITSNKLFMVSENGFLYEYGLFSFINKKSRLKNYSWDNVKQITFYKEFINLSRDILGLKIELFNGEIFNIDEREKYWEEFIGMIQKKLSISKEAFYIPNSGSITQSRSKVVYSKKPGDLS